MTIFCPECEALRGLVKRLQYEREAAEQRGRALEDAIRSALVAPYDSKAIRILTGALAAPQPGATPAA